MAESKTRISVQVTEDDIERAHKNDSYKCVVAQAVARTLPDAHYIDVDVQLIRFTRGETRYAYLTPYAVQGYVVAFDAGDEIRPFSFQLRDPKKLRRKQRTEAGKAIDAAGSRAKKKRIAPAKKSAIESEGDDVAAVKAAYADAQQSVTTKDGHHPPPRVFKKRRRAYGHRVLRINQAAAELVDE